MADLENREMRFEVLNAHPEFAVILEFRSQSVFQLTPKAGPLDGPV